jgi:hypothetical protein
MAPNCIKKSQQIYTYKQCSFKNQLYTNKKNDFLFIWIKTNLHILRFKIEA